LWQVPHFLAIALFRRQEFARAGLVVQPNEPDGERDARINVVRYTAALVAVSLMFVPLGVAGRMYLAVAATSGALFLLHGLKGLRPRSSERWARAEFVGSLAYLVVLLCVLVLDHAGST
jgi:protoheme IX farnesyltransferase